MRPLKILIIATACNPYQGSEPGTGWTFVSALAQKHHLWVLVADINKDDIEKYMKENGLPGNPVRFIFIPRLQRPLLRKLWPPSFYWYYRLWHRKAFTAALELKKEIRFDVAHQLTFSGFREPGYGWQLGIPFVWGPVGGMGFFPWRFLGEAGWGGAFYYLGYNLLTWLQLMFLSRPRLAAKASGRGLVTSTPVSQAAALKYWDCPSTLLSEIGLPGEIEKKIQDRPINGVFRIAWSGALIPRKALGLALKALEGIPEGLDWEFNIIGDGPEKNKWVRFADRLGILERCRFHGGVPREKALRIMRDSHVLLITSLRDDTSTVTVEALALGLPVVCLDHCGFSAAVTEDCGIKIPVTTPREAIAGFSTALKRLARDEEYRQKLARGALRRAGDYSWEKKLAVLEGVYEGKLETP